MGLTLKDVYNFRSAIIDFSNKLFDPNNLDVNVNNENLSQLLKFVKVSGQVKLKKEENETKEEFKKRRQKQEKELDKSRKECTKELTDFTKSTIKEYVKHTIATEVYTLLLEKHKELIEGNDLNKDDPIIQEFGKNIAIFKSQMLKNGIYNFELIDKKSRDINFDEKLKNGVANALVDENSDLMKKYGLLFTYNDNQKFMETIKASLEMENLNKFDTKEISANNQQFYGMIKNAGYSFSRRFNCGYYQMPTTIEKCPSGYKYNNSGEMVEKESKGFFQSIANFFGRLFNKGKATEYNNQLRQAKDLSFNEGIEEDLRKYNELESKKQLVNLGKEFDDLTKVAKDYKKELIAEKEYMAEQERNKEVKVGPGLDEID